jgi:hypothetical protein
MVIYQGPSFGARNKSRRSWLSQTMPQESIPGLAISCGVIMVNPMRGKEQRPLIMKYLSQHTSSWRGMYL